jgi:hypothetical protein
VPSAREILETYDFLELWSEKLFLGQEFLTWLWLTSEENGRVLKLEKNQEIEVFFENNLQLTLGKGQNKRAVSITTPSEPTELDWKEAYMALNQNKRVTRGTLRIKTDNSEWSLTLPHDTLNPQGIKIAEVKEPEDTEDLGREGAFLDRLSRLTELIGVLDALFFTFIKVRVSPDWESSELKRLQDFLATQI